MEGVIKGCVLYVLAYYIYTSSKKIKLVGRRLVSLNSYIESVTCPDSVSVGFCFLAMLKFQLYSIVSGESGPCGELINQ